MPAVLLDPHGREPITISEYEHRNLLRLLEILRSEKEAGPLISIIKSAQHQFQHRSLTPITPKAKPEASRKVSAEEQTAHLPRYTLTEWGPEDLTGGEDKVDLTDQEYRDVLEFLRKRKSAARAKPAKTAKSTAHKNKAA